MSKITIHRLDDTNTLVIKKDQDNNFFLTGDNTIIISVSNLSYMLKYMIVSGVISPKVLQATLDEYYAIKENG